MMNSKLGRKLNQRLMVFWLVLAAVSLFTGYEAILNGSSPHPEGLKGWLNPMFSAGTVIPLLTLISLVVRKNMPAEPS